MSLENLDGVVAASDHHKVIFENEAVRVLETTIRSGDTTPLHTHLTPQVMYIVSGSHFVRRDEDGGVVVDTRASPDFTMPRVLYSAGTPIHTLENTGPDDLIVIGVEHNRWSPRADRVDPVATTRQCVGGDGGESNSPSRTLRQDPLRACPMLFVSRSDAHRQASVRPIYVSLDRASLRST